MNKSESKYFNTSLLMNQALIQLLNKKDYDFITIKEICKKAGVNRSTFYLHYDNIDDLLYETIENLNKEFDSYFNKNNAVVENIDNARICTAESDDGIHWKRNKQNPILAATKSAWDSDAVYKPSVYFDEIENKALLWYNGRKGHDEYIGVATKKM